jgi:hypothetical protein
MFRNGLPSVIAFSFLTPPILGSHKFLIVYPFVKMFCASDVPRGGLLFLLGCHKKIRSSLDFVELGITK